MKKLLTLLLICMMLSGCVTMSKTELKKINMEKYKEGFGNGFNKGFTYGRLYELGETLKDLIKE